MGMAYRFVIADVFTARGFAGNQLAVLTRAQGLSDRAMQSIAREFNFAETTFVLPPGDSRHAARVRIFTPRAELPFAGHPTVGTAVVLARLGLVEVKDGRASIVFELGVGPVPVDIELGPNVGRARFTIEKPVIAPSEKPALADCAAALSLPMDLLVEAFYADGGLRFCFVRLKDKAAVDRAVLDRGAWAKHFASAWSQNFYLFAGDEKPYVRMFAPGLGVDEDPATGSGAVALAGVLASRLPAAEGTFTWPIDQGVAMGRPSRIEATAEKKGGRVMKIHIGGGVVLVAQGEIEEPPAG
jgi:trans-2,3-dihydro-3-hydroxyanthranilate isomerase